MPEMTLSTNNLPSSRPGHLRGLLEVLAVIVLLETGGVLGALTGFMPLSPILSVLLPLLAATWFLRREGNHWRNLLLGSRLNLKQLAGYSALAVAGGYAAVLGGGWLARQSGLTSPDLSLLGDLLEGNLIVYLWFLLPITWGSAAIGEEMLARGFLQHRLEGLFGTGIGIILQAAIFAAAHFYQGLVGVLNIFLLALVFGSIYIRSGRNLIPLIIAHGVIDTIGVTLLYLGYADRLTGG